MSAIPPTVEGAEKPDGSSPQEFRSLVHALAAEGKRRAKRAFATAGIAKLKALDRPFARYRLGRKCYEQGLCRDRFEGICAEIERLQAASKLKSKPLKLRLIPLFVRLGGLFSKQPVPELQAEQAKLQSVDTAIAALQARRAEIAATDTQLGLHAGKLWARLAAQTTKAKDQLQAIAAKWSARWDKRVAGTPLERLKPRYVVIGGAALVTAVLALSLTVEYWPVDETNPEAVAKQADRLAAHPSDPAKPRGIAGVPDEKLMSAGRNARALDICMKAVEFFPDEPRHLFELGRVLLLAGEPDEARDFLTEAAGLGHAGAQAYLGRLETDPEKALAIFRQAASGFPPATQMAAETDTFINRVFAEAGRKADQLAADPDDPTKPAKVKGVPDSALQSEAALENAIRACSAAIAAFPDEPRFHYELGRVLLLAGAQEDAVEHLEFAATKGNGAANAALASLQEDAMDAFAYLREARKAGYGPAKKMLAELEAKVGPDFEGDGYRYGHILRALYDSDLEFLNEERGVNLQYAKLINDAFKTAAPDLYDTRLSDAIGPQVTAIARESERPVSGRDLAVALLGGPVTRPRFRSLEPRDTDFMNEAVNRLVTTYGKNGAVAKHMAENLHIFVR